MSKQLLIRKELLEWIDEELAEYEWLLDNPLCNYDKGRIDVLKEIKKRYWKNT